MILHQPPHAGEAWHLATHLTTLIIAVPAAMLSLHALRMAVQARGRLNAVMASYSYMLLGDQVRGLRQYWWGEGSELHRNCYYAT